MEEALSFDDILCIPQYSELNSRDEVRLDTYIGTLQLSVPIVSAPMDTVTGVDMAAFMARVGGMGFIHRYCSIDKQCEMVKTVLSENPAWPVGAAVSVNGDAKERATAVVDAGAKALCIDVAHGHTRAALDMCQWLAEQYGHMAVIVSGNICTYQAALDYVAAGATALRVGIGSGSSCSTRDVAGVGVPQFTAIKLVRDALIKSRSVNDISIISDGGVRKSGDIVKAIAAGADAVMLGGLLAPYLVSAAPTVLINTNEGSGLNKIVRHWLEGREVDAKDVFSKNNDVDFGPAIVKKKLFRGMASRTALLDKGEKSPIVEGVEYLLDIDYDFERTFASLVDGVRAGLAYLGANAIWKIKGNAPFVRVTSNSLVESSPHASGEIFDTSSIYWSGSGGDDA